MRIGVAHSAPRLEGMPRKSDGLFPVRSVEQGKKLFLGEASCRAMPRETTDADVVRVCSECRRAKTIRGVWYLVPGRAPLPFVCEACFGARAVVTAPA